MSDATASYDPLPASLPFWCSLGLIPLAWMGALQGGWWIVALPFGTSLTFIAMDAALGQNTKNPDPATDPDQLTAYRMITLIWAPLQCVTLFGILWYVSNTDHLGWFAQWALFAGMGMLSGTIGINYSHELMHQKPKIERWMADLLLAMVLYSHFRSEHLLVHHRYVGTPRDPVTARYNEHFHRYFLRVLTSCPGSAFRAEAAMLARKGLRATHISNPFWRYAALQLGFLALAFWIGGLWGLFLFATQAYWAVLLLEQVNYVEHYGLTRRYLGDGKYEHVKPHHSWNASHKASNWLLINLQRHSDHHYKPDRRFPLLQTYTEADAPQLPYGYPVMTLVSISPRLWRRMMNPRVKAWRKQYYPDIDDWSAYDKASNPMPR